MWGTENIPKSESFRIFVVGPVNGIDKIIETYTTGVREFAFVPYNAAKGFIERNGNGYYLATDDAEIAREHRIKLMERKYK